MYWLISVPSKDGSDTSSQASTPPEEAPPPPPTPPPPPRASTVANPMAQDDAEAGKNFV